MYNREVMEGKFKYHKNKILFQLEGIELEAKVARHRIENIEDEDEVDMLVFCLKQIEAMTAYARILMDSKHQMEVGNE